MCAWDKRAEAGDSLPESVRPGSDARLLIPALGAWAAALLAGQVLPTGAESSAPATGSGISGSGLPAIPVPIRVLCVCTVVCAALLVLFLGCVGCVVGGLAGRSRCRSSWMTVRDPDQVRTTGLTRTRGQTRPRCVISTRGRRRAHSFCLTAIVTIAAGLTVLVVSCSQWLCLLHDPLVRARQEGVRVMVVLHVDSPVLVSSRRGSDCQYQATSQAVSAAGIALPSHASVWVWGSGPACAVAKGEEVWMAGRAARPRYGQADAWLTVPAAARVRRLRAASRFDSAVSGLWGAFLKTCRRLPLQARLLVPGMTIGVLGSQAVIGGQAAATQEEQTQADRLKNMFRQIGIVHLLAVSGGHFALVGGWTRRRLGVLGLPSWVVGPGVASADLLLASLLFPSDSVSRAVAMALIGCLALSVGRPRQAVSALSLTVLVLLIIRPRLASSMGFALSCSAVLGILLLAGPLRRALGRVRIPAVIADPLAATLAAQLFTLPVQMIMGPVPDWRVIPANLLTTPFVSLATILGLLSLLLCGPLPGAGLFLARAASIPTGVIVLIASWLEGL